MISPKKPDHQDAGAHDHEIAPRSDTPNHNVVQAPPSKPTSQTDDLEWKVSDTEDDGWSEIFDHDGVEWMEVGDARTDGHCLLDWYKRLMTGTGTLSTLFGGGDDE